MKLGKGSIVSVQAHHGDIEVHTILVVEEVLDSHVTASAAISSVNGADYVKTGKLLKGYSGELITTIQLINGTEFNSLVDSKLVAKRFIKDI